MIVDCFREESIIPLAIPTLQMEVEYLCVENWNIVLNLSFTV
jgi:hypothetical protein